MGNPLLPFLPMLAWAIFIGATLLSLTLGAILTYHWYRYAMNPPMASYAFLVFAIGTGFFLSGVLAATVVVHVAY